MLVFVMFLLRMIEFVTYLLLLPHHAVAYLSECNTYETDRVVHGEWIRGFLSGHWSGPKLLCVFTRTDSRAFELRLLHWSTVGTTVLAKERKLNFGKSLQGRYSAGKTSGPDRARRCAAMDPSGPSFLHPSTENSTAGL